MCQFMRLQMAFCDETLFTQAALKWSLSCVGSHMGLEIACLSELLETELEGTYEEFDFIFWSLYSLNIYIEYLDGKINAKRVYLFHHQKRIKMRII